MVGLLDQPVLVEGKRKRKATQQYNVETTTPKKRGATKHVGTGTKLQDIPSGNGALLLLTVKITCSVEQALNEKFKVDDLKMLYKLCFEVTGKVSNLLYVECLYTFHMEYCRMLH